MTCRCSGRVARAPSRATNLTARRPPGARPVPQAVNEILFTNPISEPTVRRVKGLVENKHVNDTLLVLLLPDDAATHFQRKQVGVECALAFAITALYAMTNRRHTYEFDKTQKAQNSRRSAITDLAHMMDHCQLLDHWTLEFAFDLMNGKCVFSFLGRVVLIDGCVSQRRSPN